MSTSSLSVQSAKMTTSDLLVKTAKLINLRGPDHKNVETFIAKHKKNKEFVELAELSRDLKRAFLKAKSGAPDRKLAKATRSAK